MNKFVISSEEHIKIIFHTYRMKIIEQYTKMENMTATFKQIADALGDNSSKVTYHGKMLIDIGVLELDHTEIINGINAKYYKLIYDVFDMDNDFKIPDVAKVMVNKQISDTLMRLITDMQTKLSDALDSDGKQGVHVSSGEVYLTDEEMKDLIDTVMEYADKKGKKT